MSGSSGAPPMSRHELLVRAKGGDGQAFADLVRPHRSMLWAVCLRVTNHPQDAEDALQDCLVAAWHNLANFRGESAISTWLYRIASNAAVAIAKKRNRVDPVEEIILPASDDSGQVEARMVVAEALGQLTPEHREILVLRELCDMTYDQIADQQGVGVQTVKSRLNRARSRMREVLESTGYRHD
ncbi:RNA polymerase sigma factor [Granulicoccus sp. GXG6511]|uniref:RNA polymerase sigma factor n=1 Tax=Granulicoccus sp. GXG6511 TaxID=3381351 RepID=UPI003D7E5E18